MVIDPNTTGVQLPSIELLQKFDVPAPRYTSYPTADRFNSAFTAKDYEDALAGREAGKPLSLYVHVPFCNDVCFYCGCNKVVTRDHSKSAEYLEVLGQEMDLVAQKLSGVKTVSQLHFGGDFFG
jgi:oxygen-independent coproporphyrinogen-3 oxidase